MSISAHASAFATAEKTPPFKLDTIDKLSGSANWKGWSVIITHYFRVTKTLGVVDGSIPKTGTAKEQEEWEQVDNAATLVFLTTIDQSIMHLIDPATMTSKQIWDTLKANYSATSTLTSFVKFKQYVVV